MTDFNSVLRKAIGNLPENTVEARRQLYARAETALVAQLQKADPPADPSRVAQMRENLRAAARNIEAEESGLRPKTQAPASQPAAAQNGPAVPQAQPAPQATAPGFRPSIPGSPGYVSPLRNRNEAAQPAPPAPAPQMAAPAPAAMPQAPAPAPAAPAMPAQPGPVMNEAVDAGYQADAAVGGTGFGDMAQPQQDVTRPPPPAFDDWPEPGAYELEPRRRSWGWLVALLVIGVLGGVGYWKRDAIMEAAQPLLALIQQKGSDDPKVDVRLSDDDGKPQGDAQGGDTAQPAGPASEPPVAPPADAVIEALLVEEGGTPQSPPTEIPGSVAWTLQREEGAPVIEGRVQIPSRNLTLSVMIRKNTDPAFPATHTIDFVFTVPPDFGGGGINNVPGLLTKSTPKARGGPLAGEVVRVDEGIFLMALLAGELDAPNNIEALSTQPFLDVPMVYADGNRAIVTMAKGPEGEKVFSEAFAEWGQQ